jgi:protein gp37
MAKRLRGRFGYPSDDPFKVTLHPDRLAEPLRWKKPRRIFVVSMGDLFHEDVPFDYIAAVFGVMAACPQHTFQVLTKRPGRTLEWFGWVSSHLWPHPKPNQDKDERQPPSEILYDPMCDLLDESKWPENIADEWPLPNVWVGVTAEDQERADERIPSLLQIPAAVRFLSCEPLLGTLDIRHVHHDDMVEIDALTGDHGVVRPLRGRSDERIHFVIVGGESGHGARPMHPDWARGLRDQCQEAGVPFFFKSLGDWRPVVVGDSYDTSNGIAGRPPAYIVAKDGTCHCFHNDSTTNDSIVMVRVGKKSAGRKLDGREWKEIPE